MTKTQDLTALSVNAIRFLAMDAVEKAKSGHPGMPMAMAPLAYLLFREVMRHNPLDPTWPNRDRFVLSAGHGSMLLYAALHLTGYDLPLEEIQRFRQWGSKTPGHPERGHTPGVEVTTGPLGQGISTAVGLALAEKKLAAEFNRPGHTVVDHYTYVLASDGDLMEGVSGEASSLAGQWGLSKLIVFWDDNRISIDGPTDLAFKEDVLLRYRAYGWQTLRVEDANDLNALRHALRLAQLDERPSLIAVRSHIGYGSPKQDSPKAHGEPLGPEAVEATRKNLGWPYPPFVVPEEVYRHMDLRAQGRAWQEAWEGAMEAYAKAYPELYQELLRRLRGELPPLPEEPPAFDKPLATRAASGKVLDLLAPRMPELLGGSADLTPSNNTKAQGMEDFSPQNPTGRYLRFGVREHGMGAILNGLNLHGGYRAYGGTFLVFSDYMRPAIRLAALMGTPTVFVFTHDSIALGEDGPTHQPVEHLMGLRAMPGLWVIRPADAYETFYAWQVALRRKEGPTALVLTRQAVPLLSPEKAKGLLRGGYVLEDAEKPQGVILATGSEVHLALKAKELLGERGVGVRVVSLPCLELFEAQPEEYRKAVLPPGLPVVAVEAGASLGWERYAHRVVGLDRFGASAPYPEVYERLGFTPERVAEVLLELV
ncbi:MULTISPECIES: transketolase [Thermus]|jgi:transketolase|uniref:Transketolase n=1 Tax=Thermus brockianus TaxID=56956 RepID=A0A1J0LV96_THEBO|nr:transketolase [Thermus brockianus]APD09940.1 transketolase [Thermus brockianus]